MSPVYFCFQSQNAERVTLQMSYLGVIPARKGSKGIPNKNLVFLSGKPLLQYTIEAASNSRLLDRIILTSDSLEMIKLASTFPRVEAPFVRPSNLAEDNSSQVDVVLHLLGWLKTEHSMNFDNIVLLQPTSPFRTSEDIDSAIQGHKCGRCLVGVSDVLQHPCEMISEEQPIRYAVEPQKEGRQFFPMYKFINGAIYITPVSFLSKEGAFYPRHDFDLFNMDRKKGMDIDDAFQLRLAEGISDYEYKM